MSQKSPQELQAMIEALAKRVERLEKYVRSVQQTLARKGIKAPTL